MADRPPLLRRSELGGRVWLILDYRWVLGRVVALEKVDITYEYEALARADREATDA